jgi:uncharacterized membrane protein YphA (DoxX/SURF4 family)
MHGDGWELGLRLVLAAVFAIAAAGKSVDRQGTRAAVVRFGIPPRLATLGAVALPAVEAVLAVGLVVGATARWAAAGSALVLAAFSVALLRARDQDCGCFGALGDRLDVQPLWRNAVLIAAALAVAISVGWLSVAAVAVVVAGLLLVLARAWRGAASAAAARSAEAPLAVTTHPPPGGGCGEHHPTPAK